MLYFKHGNSHLQCQKSQCGCQMIICYFFFPAEFSETDWRSSLFWKYPSLLEVTGIILCMGPANERRRYNVTSSLIGWVHSQNHPWVTVFHNSKEQKNITVLVELYEINNLYHSKNSLVLVNIFQNIYNRHTIAQPQVNAIVNTIHIQDCFLQKEARLCVSDAFVIEDSKFEWCFLLWKMSKW